MTRMPMMVLAGALSLGATALQAGDTLPQAASGDFARAQENLAKRRAVTINDGPARNVILFVGDGMSPVTVNAARTLAGQKAGTPGEAHVLAMETLPHLALSKTYNVDMQTPDSAGTMSAMVTGIKTRIGVLSVDASVPRGDCEAALAAPAVTLGELAEQAGMATGVVSTARLTHATPAAVYAHSPERGWEDDTALPEDVPCTDIAAQLIAFPHGDGLEVAMGGGRRHFLPSGTPDPEQPDATGRRGDGRDLTAEWQGKSNNHVYVWNTEQFEALDLDAEPRVLGLFNASHMEFELDRDPANEPSLAQMTAMAIDRLSRDEDGYFLMVEGARIDHAHHGGNAIRALEDTIAFDAAVATALEKTDADETLIIVTADHGHAVGLQGYARRGNPILGLVSRLNEAGEPEPVLAKDGKPYTVISYGNGPGSVFSDGAPEGGRPALSDEEAQAHTHRQQALVPLDSETHSGEDVAIYAGGPKAYLFDGTVEQNYIFHVIEHALDLRKRASQPEE